MQHGIARGKYKLKTPEIVRSLQGKMSSLIHHERPEIKWTAECYHTVQGSTSDDPSEDIFTHREDQTLQFESWRTAGVRKVTYFGYRAFSQEDAHVINVPRIDGQRIAIT